MGFFDKLFGSTSENKFSQIDGLIEPDPGEIARILNDSNRRSCVVRYKDPSKAIEATHWDGLTPQAQDALTKQGFYRKGDEIDVIQIEP